MLVVEKHAEPYPLPRGVHLDDEVFRVLQAAGVADEVSRAAVRSWGCGCSTAPTACWPSSAAPRGAGLNGWPQGRFVHQPDLEEVLPRRPGARRG